MGLTSQQVIDKYNRNMKAAGPSIEAGIDSSNKSQTGNAIKAKQKMIDNHQAAIARGDWEKGLKRGGDEHWKKNTKAGISRISQGIDNNQAKIAEAMTAVVAVGEQAHNATKDMPNNNIEDGIGKVRKNIETIRGAWGKS